MPIPALVSSISASATCVAEYPNASPADMAASENCLMSPADAWERDCSCAIFAPNSLDAFTMMTRPAAAVAPTAPSATPTCFNAS
jgi:hypothetical protein